MIEKENKNTNELHYITYDRDKERKEEKRKGRIIKKVIEKIDEENRDKHKKR